MLLSGPSEIEVVLHVVLLISVPDEAHHGCVVCALQDAALRRASAEGDDAGGLVPQPHSLRSIGQEVQQPVVQGGAKAKGNQFAYKMLGDDDVKC